MPAAQVRCQQGSRCVECQCACPMSHRRPNARNSQTLASATSTNLRSNSRSSNHMVQFVGSPQRATCTMKRWCGHFVARCGRLLLLRPPLALRVGTADCSAEMGMLAPSSVALALAALAGTASAEAAQLPSFLFLLGDDIVSPPRDRSAGAFAVGPADRRPCPADACRAGQIWATPAARRTRPTSTNGPRLRAPS